jgi:hypothetical protein
MRSLRDESRSLLWLGWFRNAIACADLSVRCLSKGLFGSAIAFLVGVACPLRT